MWCRSELELSLDTVATATPWTSAPACTVRTASLLPHSLFLMICCHSFLNEGSGLIVFMAALIGSHYTCRTGHPLISQVAFLLLFTRLCLRVLFGPGDPQKSVQDQLPLIIGSASAGLVVIVALVVIAVVCLK